MLATQNPVDLDYKGLSNTGTWFLGRLQTERDKARVLDGLEGAAVGQRSIAPRPIASCRRSASGMFLLHNVHDDGAGRVPDAMDALVSARAAVARADPHADGTPRRDTSNRRRRAPVAGSQRAPSAEVGRRAPMPKAPIVPPGHPAVLCPVARRRRAGRHVYAPVVLGAARVAFCDAKMEIDATRDVLYAARVTDGPLPMDWARSVRLDVPSRRPAAPVGRPPAPLCLLAGCRGAAEELRALAQGLRPAGCAERAPRAVFQHRDPQDRVRALMRRSATFAFACSRKAVPDAMPRSSAIRSKYAAKQAALAERLRRAEAAVGREQEQVTQQKTQTAVSFGATLLGAFFGRKTISTGTLGRATTAVRGVGRTMKEASDVKRAAENVDAVRAQIKELEDQVAAEAAGIGAGFDVSAPLESVTLAPKRGAIEARFVALGWMRADEAPVA